jgi:hypothetical protein
VPGIWVSLTVVFASLVFIAAVGGKRARIAALAVGVGLLLLLGLAALYFSSIGD